MSCHTVQRGRKLTKIVVESRTELYFPQRFLRLLSQRFQPLHGMLHWAMFGATCIGIARQVARKIAQCESALSFLPHKHHACDNLFFITFAVSFRECWPILNVVQLSSAVRLGFRRRI